MLADAALGGRTGLWARDRQVVRYLLKPQSLACLLKETAPRERELVHGREEQRRVAWYCGHPANPPPGTGRRGPSASQEQ